MKNKVMKILKGTDWELIKEQDNIKFLHYQNGSTKLNIWWGKMTVGILPRGQQGSFYHDVTFEELRKLLGITQLSSIERFLGFLKEMQKKLKRR